MVERSSDNGSAAMGAATLRSTMPLSTKALSWSSGASAPARGTDRLRIGRVAEP
jgi:hypothetical protein